MSLFTPIALGLILAAAVFSNAGTRLPEWYYCSAAFGAVGLLYFAVRLGQRRWRGTWPRPIAWLLGITAVVCLLQLIPLPSALVRVLSPASFAIHQAAGEITQARPFYPISVLPSGTLDSTLILCVCLVVFWITSDLAARGLGALRQLAMPLVAIGALEGLLGILQSAAGSKPNGSTGTYGNRDHYAGMLALILPLACMLALAAWRRYRQGAAQWGAIFETCLWSVASAMMLLGAGASISRMGFVAALVSMFVSGSAVLWIDAKALDSGQGKGWWMRGAAAAGAFLIAVVVVPSGALITRYGASVAGAGSFIADARLGIWKNTLPLVAHFPIFGCGFGAYQSAMMQYQTVVPLLALNYAHDDYLQLLAELGVAGFVPLLAAAILMYRTTLRHLTANPDNLLYAACLGSFAAITVHSLVDFNLYRPTSAVILAWVAGMAVGERDQSRV